MRNLLTRNRPIVFNADQYHFKMYPYGAIPEVLYMNNFEENERDFVANTLKSGMVVVDAGANVGLYTLMSSALVGVTGRVHAFEPGRLSFERLQRNLDINQCQNVVANRIALFNTHTQMILRADPAYPKLDGHRFIQSMQGVTSPISTDEIVECQTLDEYFFSLGVVIDFMKIDVEGAELALLQGAEKTLARSTNITILLECSQNREQVWNLLARHGFQSFLWDRIGRVLRPAIYDESIAENNIILRPQSMVKL
jgi:FkbM family methyltransferase